jgi:hypothetical protein
MLLLWALFGVANARYGAMAAQTLGLGAITFLPLSLALTIILGGMMLGCVGGLIVARTVR